ncbi:uncharacterized protein LOC135343970 isoform X2 [Halichondria panicea]|uniref:uncharacterized protein LOC135343970 isoform X2 n=1 Tax=Halichondria panicea TaxID=6063 RepID=UPI00312BAED0
MSQPLLYQSGGEMAISPERTSTSMKRKGTRVSPIPSGKRIKMQHLICFKEFERKVDKNGNVTLSCFKNFSYAELVQSIRCIESEGKLIKIKLQKQMPKNFFHTESSGTLGLTIQDLPLGQGKMISALFQSIPSELFMDSTGNVKKVLDVRKLYEALKKEKEVQSCAKNVFLYEALKKEKEVQLSFTNSDSEEDVEQVSQTQEDARPAFPDHVIYRIINLLGELRHCIRMAQEKLFRNDVSKSLLFHIFSLAKTELNYESFTAHVSTTNDPENQLLGLSTIIKIPIDGVEVETCLAGVTDAAILDKEGNQIFIAEVKTIGKTFGNHTMGEGQLLVSMLASFINSKMKHPVWGFLLSSHSLDIVRVRLLSGEVLVTKCPIGSFTSLRCLVPVLIACFYAMQGSLEFDFVRHCKHYLLDSHLRYGPSSCETDLVPEPSSRKTDLGPEPRSQNVRAQSCHPDNEIGLPPSLNTNRASSSDDLPEAWQLLGQLLRHSSALRRALRRFPRIRSVFCLDSDSEDESSVSRKYVRQHPGNEGMRKFELTQCAAPQTTRHCENIN